MKKQEMVDTLEAKGTAELAELAGVGLKRGRPSADLRAALIESILDAVKDKRVRIRGGELVRA